MFPMSDKNLVKYHLSPGKAALLNSCQSGSVCPYTTAVEDLHIKILATPLGPIFIFMKFSGKFD